ncbi:hypothetical protein N7488_004616 [Penicillium malachiteum]|nr:hypothetical protein N7488_004616 [Penicillium malachiteum]
MSLTKTYFLCPISDFIQPPPTGPLCLGSILCSTSTARYPLNRSNVLAVENPIPPVVETDWKKTVSTDKKLGLGVYAQFLQLASGGTQVSLEHSNKTVNSFAFDRVTTLGFEPTQEYIQEAIKAPAVQTWLRDPKQRFAPVVSLFIVTDIKIVKGARIKYFISNSGGVSGNIGIDVTGMGTAVGPKGSWVSTVEDVTQLNRDSEFVFAFRVKRLKFGRKLKVEEYNRGAFMALSGEQEDESVWVEDVDGSDFNSAKIVSDVTENGSVYCVPA